jgi:hypothetical protein
MQVQERLWFTRGEAAALVALSTRQFDEAIRPLIEKSSIRGGGKTLRFAGPGVVSAMLAYRSETAKPPVDDDVDPLLAIGDSPALERYRLGKAKMIEMDLAEREKATVQLDALREGFRPFASILRSAGERLARQYGNDAAAIYNEALEDAEASALRVLSDAGHRRDDVPDLADGGGEGATASHPE